MPKNNQPFNPLVSQNWSEWSENTTEPRTVYSLALNISKWFWFEIFVGDLHAIDTVLVCEWWMANGNS